MAVGLPSGVAETLGEAAAVVGAAGSGASAAPLTVMVPGSRGLPERNPGSNRRGGLERENHNVSLFSGQVAVLGSLPGLYVHLQNVPRLLPFVTLAQPCCVSPELMEQARDQSVSCFCPRPCHPVPTLQPCELSMALARLGASCSNLSQSSLQSRSHRPYHGRQHPQACRRALRGSDHLISYSSLPSAPATCGASCCPLPTPHLLLPQACARSCLCPAARLTQHFLRSLP